MTVSGSRLTREILINRAQLITGKTLGTLAASNGINIPVSIKRGKGWAGRLIELSLSGSASTHAGPDFPELGIELKTLPLNQAGKPCESTYVCTLSPHQDLLTPWHSSRVRQKLAQVLWIPVEGVSEIPLAERRIGAPILWQPTPEQETTLKADWEELTGMIRAGYLASISGHHGQYLQIRPKARNARSLQKLEGADDDPDMTLPRGYYLRTVLTQQILKNS